MVMVGWKAGAEVNRQKFSSNTALHSHTPKLPRLPIGSLPESAMTVERNARQLSFSPLLRRPHYCYKQKLD